MTRVIEGSTLAGFECDEANCTRKATHTPVLCVPHFSYPIEVIGPMFSFIDTHVCPEHMKAVKGEDITSPKMIEQFEAIAAAKGTRPDFKRAYIEWAPVHSDSYQKFQEAAGLVEPGDATVKGSIIAPPEIMH